MTKASQRQQQKQHYRVVSPQDFLIGCEALRGMHFDWKINIGLQSKSSKIAIQTKSTHTLDGIIKRK